MVYAAMEVTTQPCGLTNSANLGERGGEQQENKSSQINFGSRDGGRIGGPILLSSVHSTQTGVLDHGVGRHWTVQTWAAGPANQAATSDQLTSTVPNAYARLSFRQVFLCPPCHVCSTLQAQFS